MNTKNYKKSSITFLLMLSCLIANAAIKTWTGATSTNWSTASNWTGGSVPSSSDTAIIPGSLSNYPVISNANTTIRRIIINGGLSNLTNNNGRSLTVTGSMVINDGVYTASSNFSTPNLIINGGSVITGPNCVFSISNNLLLNGGSINLSSVSSISISSVDANSGTMTINSSKAINTFSGIFSIDGGTVIIAANSGDLLPNSNGVFELISGELDLNNQNLDVRNEFNYSGGTFSNIGTLSASIFNMDYNGTLTLNFKLKVNSTLNLTNGWIKSNANHLVTFKSSASANGANLNSHIIGPVRKELNTSNNFPDFEFPIGNGVFYAPLTLSNFSNRSSSDTFTAYYSKGANINSNGNLGSGINNVSTSEYWAVSRTSSSTPQTNAAISLSYDVNRSGPINDATLLRIVSWDGSQWNNLGRTTTSSTSNNSGNLTSTSNTSGFNFFTLGSSTNANPLPVKLINLSALRLENEILVKWSTTSEIGNNFFTVQKSIDGLNWIDIGRVEGIENSSTITDYFFSDVNVINGWQYYRLVQFDLNGASTTSSIVAVNANAGIKVSLNVSPIPVNNILTINSNSNEMVDIVYNIYNASGQLVLSGKENNVLVNIDVTTLTSGVYLSEISINGLTSKIKFLK